MLEMKIGESDYGEDAKNRMEIRSILATALR
jgi:hypothetical protein